MSIHTDDTNIDTGLSDNDAVAALMGSMGGKAPKEDAADPSDDEDEDGEDGDLEADEGNEPEDADGDDEASDEDEDENDDADNEGEEEEDQNQSTAQADVSDDAVVKITVDGEEKELTIGSLKRLAGQEASLTRKSQEADVVGQRAAATLQGALEAVLEDLEAYENVDWVLEGNRMDPDEFAWHREQFTKLAQRRDKLIGNAQNLEATVKKQRETQLTEQAAEAVKVLSDPKTGIPGWNDDLYQDILGFAVEAGLPEGEVAQIVNPHVIKLINDARLYRKAQKDGAGKLQLGTKQNLTPKNVRKGPGRERIAAAPEKNQQKLEARVKSGRASDDDAIAALVGRWGVKRR